MRILSYVLVTVFTSVAIAATSWGFDEASLTVTRKDNAGTKQKEKFVACRIYQLARLIRRQINAK